MFRKFLLLAVSVMTVAAQGEPQFKHHDTAKNLSSFIRSNASHFWGYMRKGADLDEVRDYMNCVGVIAGDPHMGNFGPMPVTDKRGRTEMAFVNIDFDDAGIGPLVLDFIRYLITVKATFEDISKRHLEEAYIAGLEGSELRPPAEVREMLRMSVKEYQKQAAEYTASKTDKNGFLIEEGEVEKYRGRIARATIEKLFPGETVIDVAKRINDVGGSANSLRLWVLVEGEDGRRRIMELKQYQETAMRHYQPQPPPETRVRKVRNAFWPGLTDEEYKLVDVKGGGFFWLREKKVSLIDVPYSSEKKKDLAFAEGLAIYDANQLGLAHSRGAKVGSYLKAIEANREAFHDAVETIVNGYLDFAAKARKNGN